MLPGTYVLRDDLHLATPPPHPSEAPVHNPNPLATTISPPSAGTKLSLVALAPRVRGRLYVGPIGGNVFTGVTVDSVELRGPDDSLFVAVGRLTIHYSPRDLWDRRVVLERVEVDRPVLRLAQAEGGR